ncbi:MAG TPA: Rieske (2Fe-2S) protein [Nocardioidaceae bacterium]|nr:Rieske (2Fe-2S) protein [Nocardioidaceae bacterium]
MTERTELTDQSETEVSRRTLLRGAAMGGLALPVLAACGGEDEPADTAAEETSSASEPATTDPSASESVPAGTTVPVADVPVGGGTILAAEKLVVTQPTKGQFKAFDINCTHKGCPVKSIEGDQIICPCHGSAFSITDGAPTKGPATAPLGNRTATVSGDQISVA